MKKNLKEISKILQIRTLRNIFFFTFFLLSIYSYSQSNADSLNYLLRNNLNIDTLRADSFFVQGRLDVENGDIESALDNFLKCYFIRNNVLAKNNDRIAFAANRIGSTCKELGRLDDAIDYYQIALDIYVAKYGVENSRNAVPYTNLANVYQLKGNLEDAIKYHEEAVNLLEKELLQGEGNLNNTLRAKFNLAGMYYQKDQYQKALNLILNCYNQAVYYDKADFLSLLGNIYVKLNDNYKAREYFNLSIQEMLNNELDSRDSLQLANLYIGFSDFLISKDEYDEAEKNLHFAKPLISDTINGRDISNFYFTMGSLYSKRKYDSNSIEGLIKTNVESLNLAINYFQKAIIAVSDSFLNLNPSANPSIKQCQFPSNTLKILQKKSESFYELAQLRQNNKQKQLSDLINSLAATNLASDLLNNLRTGIVNEESKIAMTQMQNSIYLFGVKIAYQLYILTNNPEYFEFAFNNAERNKAASLLDNLTSKSARQLSFIPDTLIKKEENINNQISMITQNLYDENEKQHSDPVLIQIYNSQLFQLDLDKKEFNRYLEENFKEYYQLKYAEDKISIITLQKQLAKNEIILEYVLNNSDNSSSNTELY
ncbi:MAG: tetratricopeptide repeat protein, partial [Prolixibacteraceae bacterium]|nr:tetratricopeptide repeat protein [Prolixibacteraceae bacterium]